MAMGKDAAKAFRQFMEMMMDDSDMPEDLKNETKVAFQVEDITNILFENFNPARMTHAQVKASAEYLTLVKAGLETFVQQMKGEQNEQT